MFIRTVSWDFVKTWLGFRNKFSRSSSKVGWIFMRRLPGVQQKLMGSSLQASYVSIETLLGFKRWLCCLEEWLGFHAELANFSYEDC